MYALCFYKSPYDEVFERGDSVALAVSSATLNFPQQTDRNHSLLDLISTMLIVDPKQRPFIIAVLESVEAIKSNTNQPT